jgi:hypothetical protein
VTLCGAAVGEDGWVDIVGLCVADGLWLDAVDVFDVPPPQPASASTATAMSAVVRVRRTLILLITGQTVGVGRPATRPTRGRNDAPA